MVKKGHMIKLLDAKKDFILEMFAVLIVFLFMATSASAVADNFHNSLSTNRNWNPYNPGTNADNFHNSLSTRQPMIISQNDDYNFKASTGNPLYLTGWENVTAMTAGSGNLYVAGYSYSGSVLFGYYNLSTLVFTNESDLILTEASRIQAMSYGDGYIMLAGSTANNDEGFAAVLSSQTGPNESGMRDITGEVSSAFGSGGSIHAVGWDGNAFILGGWSYKNSPLGFYYPLNETFRQVITNISPFATDTVAWNGNSFLLGGAMPGYEGEEPGTPPFLGCITGQGRFENLNPIIPSWIGIVNNAQFDDGEYLLTGTYSQNESQFVAFLSQNYSFENIASQFAGFHANGITSEGQNFIIYGNGSNSNGEIFLVNTQNQSIANEDEILPSGTTSVTFSINYDEHLILSGISSSGSFIKIINSTNPAAYSIKFSEIGLPAGTSWYVNLSNGMESGPITGSSYSFLLPNGTYLYTVGNVSGYLVSPSAGNITVSGESVENTIAFSLSNTYNISLGVLYRNSPYTVKMTVNSTALIKALLVKPLPEELSLQNISAYLYDFLTNPASYNIYSVEILNQSNSRVTNATEAETILDQTFVWAMLYNYLPDLQNSYGRESASYANLTYLQQTQWVQDAGIYLSDFVNYATLIGPILGGISSYFSSNSAEVKLADMATHAIFDLMKGYESLKNKYGLQDADSILSTLAQYGLISSSNPSSYNASVFITNLAQVNPSDMNSIILSIYSDLGVQSSQVPSSVEDFVARTLENLGENALSIGISTESSSAVVFLQSYFSAGSVESASSAATEAAADSIESSASDFLAFMLPLSIASAIYSSYLEPMSSDAEQVVNAQDLMYNTLYPAVFSALGSYSDGNYANITDAASSMFIIGLIQSEWSNWLNESAAELKGEFLNSEANYEITIINQFNHIIFGNIRAIYFAIQNASLMANSLVNKEQPKVLVSQFSEATIILPISINASKIGGSFGQAWSDFTSVMSTAKKYAEDGWSDLSSGISSLSSTITNFFFGRDPPEFTVIMDNFTSEQEGGVFRSTYPMASIIYGNDYEILVLPGNISGYLSTEVNESVEMKAIYYNESSPQTTRILTSLNAEAGNAYVMYINSTSAGKKSVIEGYSLSFSESNYGNIPWKVELVSSNGSIRSVIGSNDSVIVFNDLPDGSYNFSVISLNASYRTIPKNGTITVNESNVSERIIFSKVEYTYEVTFTESGLPSGTMWYVNLTESNGTIYRSGGTTGTSITFSSLFNGTYSYTIATSDHTYKPSVSSGSLLVNGKNQTISVAFTEVKYTVTFTESGLQSGTIWYVNLSNRLSSAPISRSSYSFSLTNGTYSYTVSSVYGYSISPSFESVNVSGDNVSVAITFTPVTTIVSKYTITFTETSLPSGTSWSVTLNGTTVSSTSSTITFSMINGTYSYKVFSVSGYTLSPSSGNITVMGKNTTQSITFTHNTSKNTPFKLSSIELYAIIGAVVAIAAIGGALMLIRKRK